LVAVSLFCISTKLSITLPISSNNNEMESFAPPHLQIAEQNPHQYKFSYRISILYVWAELTTPQLGGSYSQQPLTLVRFSVRELHWVLQCLNHSTQVSDWKSHQWLLRIRAAQFLHDKFGEIFENKSTNYLFMLSLLNPLTCDHCITLPISTLRSHPQVQTTFIFNDLSIQKFILGVWGFWKTGWSIQAKRTVKK
jgi:hypothetical protein